MSNIKRTRRALQNTLSSVSSYFIVTVMGLIVQRVLKVALGTEYLGVSGLFTNIISGLNVVELGFGSAVIINMYRAVAEEDVRKICSLVAYYKKVYRIIALVVLSAGIALLPFLGHIVGTTKAHINIQIVFLLYLADSVASYFLTYKRSMLYAHQRDYCIIWIHTGIVFATNLLQIVLLIKTHSFYFYLLSSIVLRIAENLMINSFVNREYPYLRTTSPVPLDNDTKGDIKKKVYGLFFHKISTFIVNGTDNIIISMVPGLGVVWVGVYANYALIKTKLCALVDNTFGTLNSGVGNLLIVEEKEKAYQVFRNLKFLNTWIYTFFSISFYCISFPFIRLWMGPDFVLDEITVAVIAVNMFVSGNRASYGTFKNVAGIFYEDRFVPIIESIVNLATSIPLAMLWGIKGVLLGTIASTFIVYVYSYPKYVYGQILGKSLIIYIKDLFEGIIQFAICFFATICFMSLFTFDSAIVLLFTSIGVCLVVPNVILLLINVRTKEFRYYCAIIAELFRKVITRMRGGRE